MQILNRRAAQVGMIVFAVVLLAAAGTIYLYRAEVAAFAWNKHQWGEVALALGINDTSALRDIGEQHYGSTFSKEYNPTLAQRAYMRLIEIDPQARGVYVQLARIYFVQGRLVEALDMVEREMEISPEDPLPFYMRGLIYGYRNQAGDLERAEADFKKYVEERPDEWAGYNDLAWVLLKQGKYEEADAFLSGAIVTHDILGVNPWILNSLGVALLNDGQYARAAEIFDGAYTLAEQVTPEQWHAAYSGNSPDSIPNDLAGFRASIKRNLERARLLSAQ
jgi:tetratricopeptide (TPR) repeat protein